MDESLGQVGSRLKNREPPQPGGTGVPKNKGPRLPLFSGSPGNRDPRPPASSGLVALKAGRAPVRPGGAEQAPPCLPRSIPYFGSDSTGLWGSTNAPPLPPFAVAYILVCFTAGRRQQPKRNCEPPMFDIVCSYRILHVLVPESSPAMIEFKESMRVIMSKSTKSNILM